MIRYNSDVENIKHNVLTEIARVCFEDLGKDYYNSIPYKIIPGMAPRYRCCVFKEREILRQRMLLASGKAPAGNAILETVNVIKEACHGCPINRYQVTPNCQKCLAKGCIKECRFGAISIGATGAYIDQSKCRECGKCVQACPYNAITDTQRPCVKHCPVDAIGYDADKLAVIDKNKCIECGGCIKSCPFGAISESSDICEIIKLLKGGENVIALIAPAIEGQFGQVNLGGIMNAAGQLGFKRVIEVSVGADAVAAAEAHEVSERVKSGKKTLTSCCPAFYNLIEKHFPQQTENISSTVSPMAAAARLARTADSNAKIVFIGPCIAKKSEVKRGIAGNADYVMTFEELAAMFDAKNIKPESAAGGYGSSTQGRGFSAAGGVAAAVKSVFEQTGDCKNVVCQNANGTVECIKALNILKAGKADAGLIEGMACEGGCVAGPAVIESPQNSRKNKILIQNSAAGAGRTDINISGSIEKSGIKNIPLTRNAVD